ncbi:ABC transporter substrate-binding protein [Cellulosimicrobium cellulans]|uniref:ABC transporter substrate-binding protein n=1 Tax=Cellulosimicrobium cellulans TaxID=1710 RepID=UPI000848B538|nr:extracellular solute-binding protein [Cellulosimicrobium cellulans]
MNVRTRLTAAGALALSASVVLAGCSTGGGGSEDASTLTVYIDTAPNSIDLWEGIAAAYADANPDVTIEVETHPGGSEGDNLVKTRLATGEMNELLWYNSGSLFQALNPDQNFHPLDDEEWVSKVSDDFKTVVSTDTALYGAPVGPSFGGAIIYNKDVYADLGLEIPTTWDEFMANNEAVKAAGLTAVVQTYGDTWTSQVPVLGDFYNVETIQPGWAEDYTAGKAKFAEQPALAGFEHLQELADAGVMNEDFASATYDDGVRLLAEGEAAHYPMLTSNVASAIGENFPEAADTLGTFPIPSEDPSVNGLTLWMPNGIYIPKSFEGERLEAAKEFVAWLTTPEACAVQAETITLGGPFVIDGCELPEDVPAVVSDMQPYLDEGNTGLALEFLSPIKGPALEQITVEVGSGIRSAQDGAALYDEDVKKQAQQLGLEGW